MYLFLAFEDTVSHNEICFFLFIRSVVHNIYVNIIVYTCVLLFSFTFACVSDGTLCLKLLIIRWHCDLAELRGWTPLPPLFPHIFVLFLNLLYFTILYSTCFCFFLFETHWDNQSMWMRLFWMMAVLSLAPLQGWCCAAKNGHQSGFSYCRENFLSWRGLQVSQSLVMKTLTWTPNFTLICLLCWNHSHGQS